MRVTGGPNVEAAAEVLRETRRILLVGPPGSGKSTLARRLGPLLGLPVVHLDRFFWHPGWVPTARPEWIVLQEALVARERWLIDGNYGGTLEVRLRRAEAVVFIDLPRRVYFGRVLRRVLAQYGRTRADLAAGCPERLDLAFLGFVWRFARRARPQVEAALGAAEDGVAVLRLTEPGQIAALVAALQAAGSRHDGQPV